jgi:hypothetical protein
MNIKPEQEWVTGFWYYLGIRTMVLGQRSPGILGIDLLAEKNSEQRCFNRINAEAKGSSS